MKFWAVRVLALTLWIGAINAFGFDENSFKDDETLSIALTQINSAMHIDGVGGNEFRFEVVMKIWHAESGVFGSISTEYNLGKSKKVYMYANEKQQPTIAPVLVKAKRLNELYRYYRKYYGADHYEIRIVLNEVDPIFNDYVTTDSFEKDEDLELAREEEGAALAINDWTAPYSYTYETTVSDHASGIAINTNGGATFVTGKVGSHTEKRIGFGGGGSKLTGVYQIKVR